MFEKLNADIKRVFVIDDVSEGTFSTKVFVLCFSYGLHALLIYRMEKAIRKNLSKGWGLILYYPLIVLMYCLRFMIKELYGIHVDWKAEIGKGFYIGHFGDIKIGYSIIGDNCSVHQMVSIGVEPQSKNYISPVIIEDNVWIGAHSTIVKGVNIGSGASISAGSKVINDISSKTLVMGNPARIIIRNYDNSSLM